ncbi:conserved hypothetical protein (plasmid) [Borreliella garinii PBr]|uniref:Uncharacterized protein n=1 Tax=Borreliella garinii PBr TaxID=498743 RepID=B8F1F1_BORGR|nr:conserved hypothetical protein [Borreliella garinii PBr]
MLGEWIASTDSIFTQINITQDYMFTSPIAYFDFQHLALGATILLYVLWSGLMTNIMLLYFKTNDQLMILIL